MIKIEKIFKHLAQPSYWKAPKRSQFLPLLDFRVDCLLLFPAFFTSAFSGVDSGSWRLDPPFVACFLMGGSSGVVSSGLDRLPPLAVAFLALGALGDDSGLERLDPPRFVSFSSSSSSGSSGEESRLACLDRRLVGSSSASDSSDSGSGLDSLYTGFLVVRWLSLLTAGFLGFLEGAPLLTGVAVDSFLAADCFLPPFLAEEAAALTGDFLAGVRPRLLAFD